MNMLFFSPKIIHFIIEFKLDDKNFSLPSSIVRIHRKRLFLCINYQLLRNNIHNMRELHQELHNISFNSKLELEARFCIAIGVGYSVYRMLLLILVLRLALAESFKVFLEISIERHVIFQVIALSCDGTFVINFETFMLIFVYNLEITKEGEEILVWVWFPKDSVIPRIGNDNIHMHLAHEFEDLFAPLNVLGRYCFSVCS